MTPRRQRLYAILMILSGIAVALALTLFALRDHVTFFYSPSDIVGAQARFIPPNRPFRLGGLVVEGSVKKMGPSISFEVTDLRKTLQVSYTGITPGLFHEGKGVVALGSLNKDGVFIATELLAKHDENYMPPEVARALKKNTAP